MMPTNALFNCFRYKSGFRSSTVRSSNSTGSGRLCEVRRAYKATVVPCKTGRRRARGMSMGQKVSGGVKSVSRDAAAPYKPVIPRELAQVRFVFLLARLSSFERRPRKRNAIRKKVSEVFCSVVHFLSFFDV